MYKAEVYEPASSLFSFNVNKNIFAEISIKQLSIIFERKLLKPEVTGSMGYHE